MAHILVFDDDESLRTVLVQTLMMDQHQVTEGHGRTHELKRTAQAGFDLIVTGTLLEHESVLATIGMLASVNQGFPVVALGGGCGLLNTGFTADAATAKGIRLIVLKDLVRTNLRQAVAEALAPVLNGN
jgi:DNA-binding NtrC family response regulator